MLPASYEFPAALLIMAGGALACGVTLATCVGLLGSGTGPPALGLALLGLATAWSYAATPRGAAATNASRWRSVTSRLERHQQDRRSRRQLQDARAREAAAHAAVRQLREELAVLVPQLFAAEQSALLRHDPNGHENLRQAKEIRKKLRALRRRRVPIESFQRRFVESLAEACRVSGAATAGSRDEA